MDVFSKEIYFLENTIASFLNVYMRLLVTDQWQVMLKCLILNCGFRPANFEHVHVQSFLTNYVYVTTELSKYYINDGVLWSGKESMGQSITNTNEQSGLWRFNVIRAESMGYL